MARRRRVDRLGLFYALVVFGLLVGGSVWLDRRGESVVARVIGKTEAVRVTHDPRGGWLRHYRVGAGFDVSGAPMAATLTVDRARYDALRQGDTLEIRYLPFLPLYARTPDRSTATVAAEAAGQLLGSRLLRWTGIGLLAMVIAARIGIVPIVVTGVLWIVAGYAVLLRAPQVPEPSGLEASARVRAVTLVTKSPARRTARRRSRAFRSESATRLEVPYQVIELQVPVQGRPDSLLAVDAVDSGSVAGLAVGEVVRVRHPADDPRAALLTEGARTFLIRNRYHYRPIVIGLPILGMLGAWGFRSRRGRRGERPGSSSPARAVASALVLLSAAPTDGFDARPSASDHGGTRYPDVTWSGSPPGLLPP
jgi:hypothetical protein